jgi:hypothetical protein
MVECRARLDDAHTLVHDPAGFVVDGDTTQAADDFLSFVEAFADPPVDTSATSVIARKTDFLRRSPLFRCRPSPLPVMQARASSEMTVTVIKDRNFTPGRGSSCVTFPIQGPRRRERRRSDQATLVQLGKGISRPSTWRMAMRCAGWTCAKRQWASAPGGGCGP